MWVKWVTIHESYGLPRIAQELRRFLELNGISVRLIAKRTKRAGHLYLLQVPQSQQQLAEQYVDTFKNSLS